MEVLNLNLYCTALTLIITIFVFRRYFQKNQLPPSPPGAFPIIGHLHLLKGPRHRVLKTISDKYGPIVYLRLGNRPTVVVSSPSVAEECFTKNIDIVLANRPQFILSKLISYNSTSIPFSPYGEHWRNLRRITAIHIFSSLSLQNSAGFRSDEIRSGVRNIFSGSSGSEIWTDLNLTSFFQNLVQNVMMKMVCGKGWSTSADIFKQISSLTTMSDYIPILRWIGFDGGAKKKAADMCKQMDKFMQDLIDEGRRNRGTSSCSIQGNKKQRKTILETYLSLQDAEPEYYTDNMIKVMTQVSHINSFPNYLLPPFFPEIEAFSLIVHNCLGFSLCLLQERILQL